MVTSPQHKTDLSRFSTWAHFVFVKDYSGGGSTRTCIVIDRVSLKVVVVPFTPKKVMSPRNTAHRLAHIYFLFLRICSTMHGTNRKPDDTKERRLF